MTKKKLQKNDEEPKDEGAERDASEKASKQSEKKYSRKLVWVIGAVAIIGGLIFLGTPPDKPLKDTSHSKQVVSSRYYNALNKQVVVQFSRYVEQEKQAKLSDKDFSCSKWVSGKLVWKSHHSVALQFEKPLKAGQYTCSIAVPKLFSWIESPYEFSFDVDHNEVKSFSGDIAVSLDRETFTYEGDISFSQPQLVEVIQKAIRFRQKGDLAVTWTALSDNTYRFKTVLDSDKHTIYIEADGDALNLQSDYIKTIDPDVLINMNVESVTPTFHGEQKEIIIQFTELVSKEQALDGFLSVSPGINYKLRRIGKNIYLSGEFLTGETYQITIAKGLKSHYDKVLEKERTYTVTFEKPTPKVEFLSDGIFLPTVANQRIRFKAVNIPEITYTVEKVFANNLTQFLHQNKLESAVNRSGYYYGFNRVGVSVVEGTQSLSGPEHQWNVYDIDVSELIKNASPLDMYIVKITYKNPNQRYRSSTTISKPVIITNIGASLTQTAHSSTVTVTDVRTLEPIPNANVIVKSYQDQVITTAYTNANGVATFKTPKSKTYYIDIRSDGYRGVVVPNEMAWDTNRFDVSGTSKTNQDVRVFTYTDRGVYRPGDTVYLSAIARDNTDSWPKKLSVTCKVYNPKGQVVYTTVQKTGLDGLYSFKIPTKRTDLTGQWKAALNVGSEKVIHTFSVETVVPARLKATVKTDKDTVYATDTTVKIDVKAAYLFGAPADSNTYKLSVDWASVPVSMPKKWSEYRFGNETHSVSPVSKGLTEGTLSSTGEATLTWNIPVLSPEEALRAIFHADVYEKGGRHIRSSRQLVMHRYPHYVGLKMPNKRFSYYDTNTSLKMKVVALTPKGESAKKTISYRIYNNHRYWWWEYNSKERFKLNYKSSEYTELVKQGQVNVSDGPATITFLPKQRGTYLIEAYIEGEGHTVSHYFDVSHWGDTQTKADANTLELTSSKSKYTVGETAVLQFPSPQKGVLQVSLIKGEKILNTYQKQLAPVNGIQTLRIPVTKEMAPNVYVALTLIQPYRNTANDVPMRAYGIIPLIVQKPDAKLDVSLDVADTLQPNQPFKVTLQTADKRPATFTLAVVDEGLLSLTGFKTPDPYAFFYQKQRLNATLSDNYNYMINAHVGDVLQSFKTGGGAASKYLRSQLAPVNAQRFKPVVLFEGPFQTNNNGFSSMTFTMPSYIGAVRVMAISTDNDRYGSIEKTVPVKTELMVLPTLPRVLAPGDEIDVPVEVFWNASVSANVGVSIQTEGPIDVVGSSRAEHAFNSVGSHTVTFKLKAKSEVSTGKIIIKASGKSYRSEKITDIAIRPIYPRMFESESSNYKPGDTASIIIPETGLLGTNATTLVISSVPKLDLAKRLDWLIRYPYGCIEQITSSVFPQLYLPFIQSLSNTQKNKIDSHINTAIERLQSFVHHSGGFTYWPNGQDVHEWGTNYAGDFLIRAKALGYYVPNSLYEGWLRFQSQQAMTYNHNSKHNLIQIQRLKLLAQAGSAKLSEMNALKEQTWYRLSTLEKWLLAHAYELAGHTDTANALARKIKTYVDTTLFSKTFSSPLRNQAMIFDAAASIGVGNTTSMYESIRDKLSSDNWYSTQALGYALVSVGGYLTSRQEDPNFRLKGSLQFPNGTQHTFNTSNFMIEIPVPEQLTGTAMLVLDKDTTVKDIGIKRLWSGIPKEAPTKRVAQKLDLDVKYYTNEGDAFSVKDVKQGKQFWMVITVRTPKNKDLDELALVQLLPSGWEIQNSRLSTSWAPEWLQSYNNLNKYEYMDIRDDRIMWFFDGKKRDGRYTFAVLINAVTAGEFELPPTLVEAMYDDTYKAIQPGYRVIITP